MNPTARSTLRPLAESPWYWAYLFCTGGLIALVVIGPKYALRQSQIEQNGQKRQWAAQLAAGRAVTDSPEPDVGQAVPLWPLFVLLGGCLGVAWIKLIRDHVRRRRAAMQAPPSGDGPDVTSDPDARRTVANDTTARDTLTANDDAIQGISAQRDPS